MAEVFKIGHYYKFKDGRAFYVSDICTCESCIERGLREPYVCWLDNCSHGWFEDYITKSIYDRLASEIEVVSPTKEEWVDIYIAKTINENTKALLDDIKNLLKK